jgi:DNA-binding GntR family transcriptional regulator
MNDPAVNSKRQLAAEIAAAIRTGAYRPGEWLRQVDLEEAFGAKRFDVRTALNELAMRGTVTHETNRGYRVTAPDLNVIRELLAIRVLLEAEAASLALPRIGVSELEHIRVRQRAFEDAIVHGDIVEQANCNAAFHDAIYGYGPNRALAVLVTEMRDRSRLWPIALWPSHAASNRSAEDHREIIKAIEARDDTALRETVKCHITGSAANYPKEQERGEAEPNRIIVRNSCGGAV